jgi:intracellular sulfur oxidation DsrE/DsrF family protein
MNDQRFTEEQLNLYIDEQLDTEEMHQIHDAMSKDSSLRERICQLKAVRELVGIAYQSPPEPENPRQPRAKNSTLAWRSLAASLVLGLGILLGWGTYDLNPLRVNGDAAAVDAFKFYSEQAAVDHNERKIILHISTDDIGAVKSALDEADNLIASYRKANTSLKMDIITNKDGINLLRADVSPYVDRIESMVHDSNVSLYACERSIMKAEQREGKKMVFLPETVTTKSARELIPERLKQGWIYIKV